MLKPWYQEEKYFKNQANVSKYTTTLFFFPPVQYLTAMLSRLHREVDNTFFKSEWIPLDHGVMSVGIVFNWVGILSTNILRALEKAVQNPDARGPLFISLVLS